MPDIINRKIPKHIETNMTVKECIDRLIRYFEFIFKSGVVITEKATIHIGEALDVLLKDSNRIANLSSNSLVAIKKVQIQLMEAYQKNTERSGGKALLSSNPNIKLSSIINALKELSKKDNAINDLINPILTSLQYQDRIQQNLGNLSKFMVTWGKALSYNTDEDIMNVFDPQENTFDALGQMFYDQTTMEEEREILRLSFTGLKDKEVIADTEISFF